MDWIYHGIAITLDVSVIFLHLLALTLLFRLKQNNVKGNQKILIEALCATELTSAVMNILQRMSFALRLDGRTAVFFVFNSTTVTFMYIFVMTFIVVDRFLEIYLNIKYNVLWSSKKTKIVLFVGLATCCLLFVPFIIIELNNPFYIASILYPYIYPVLESLFIIVFICSYFYIIRQVLRYRRNIKKLEKELSKNSRVVYHKQFYNRFKLFVPTLIVVTFIIFMVAPNTLRSFSALKLINATVGYSISYFLIPFGFLADPIIYIFSLKTIRLAFRRILPSNNSVHTTKAVYV